MTQNHTASLHRDIDKNGNHPSRSAIFKNNVGPQVRKQRNALGWSQSVLATKLQIAGWDTTRSGVSKIEARMIHVNDRALIFLAEVLSMEVSELLPKRDSSCRLHEFMLKLETWRF